MALKRAFIFTHCESAFVKKDQNYFKSVTKAECLKFDISTFPKAVRSITKQFVLLFKSIFHDDAIYISLFSCYHSFLPTLFSILFRKNHYIILHGSDVNIIPSLNYGHNQKSPLKYFNIFSLKYATHLLPVSDQLISFNNTFNPDEKILQGLNHIVPSRKGKTTVIHNSVDSNVFRNYSLQRIPNSFITVCADATNSRRFLLKGLDLFSNLAELHPNWSYTIVGILPENMNFTIPSNIQLIPFQDKTNLSRILNTHEYYLQLSLVESFGLSLSEAILCGCIPLVSRVGKMVDIVNHPDHILDTKSLPILDEKIMGLLNTPDEVLKNRNEEMAESIRLKYTANMRYSELNNLIFGT